jgi:hypothetical protein
VTPEGKVKAQVRKGLRPIARLWEFMPVQNGMGKPALDFLLCVNGHFIAIETKAKGKKLTTRQEHTKAEMEGAGAVVFVVDDATSLDKAMSYVEQCAYGEEATPYDKTGIGN